MVKKILLGLAAILAVLAIGFVIVVAVQPSTFRVERTATMAAPAEEIFAQVNDFHRWEDWSPWLNVDPNAKTTYEGPTSGEGAIFRWAGNEEVGEGSMTITESRPHELVRIELHFLKPMEGKASCEFNLRPAGDQTAVTWSMDGKNDFTGKAVCLFMDMDQMIGGKYEEGLGRIKKIVEASSQVQSAQDQSESTPSAESQESTSPGATP